MPASLMPLLMWHSLCNRHAYEAFSTARAKRSGLQITSACENQRRARNLLQSVPEPLWCSLQARAADRFWRVRAAPTPRTCKPALSLPGFLRRTWGERADRASSAVGHEALTALRAPRREHARARFSDSFRYEITRVAPYGERVAACGERVAACGQRVAAF